jgi:hypothetical protein
VYFEKGKYDVYTLNNPRLVGQQSGITAAVDAPVAPVAQPAAAVTPAPVVAEPPPQVLGSTTVYRGQEGFRPANQLRAGDDSSMVRPLQVASVLGSAEIGAPDTTEFTLREYRSRLEPSQVLRPSIGYVRDNFGRGVTGQAGVVLDDMLGNRQALIAASLNGRVEETQFVAAYQNLGRRWNWGASLSQDPYFFYNGAFIETTPNSRDAAWVTQIRRIIYRQAAASTAYPFSRFQRVELGLNMVQLDDAVLEIVEPFDAVTGFPIAPPSLRTEKIGSIAFAQPRAAFVFDNSLSNYVGTFLGKRYRFEVSQAIGGWSFTQGLADYRRYDRLFGPFTLATRGLYFGRMGKDAENFTFFGGSTELIRGYTYGSFERNECSPENPDVATACRNFDALVGSQVAVASAELRFPLLYAALGFLPIGFPPIEGALFYDIGMVWDKNSTLKWRRDAGDDPFLVRVPLQTLGVSARTNVLGIAILRVDYSVPQRRPGMKGLWTLSLSPAF